MADAPKKIHVEAIMVVGLLVIAMFALYLLLGGREDIPSSAPGETSARGDVEELLPDFLKVPLSKPDAIVPLAPGSANSLRTFNVRASRAGFSPAQVVVVAGDVIQFNVTAVDGTYDINMPDFYSYIYPILKGTTQSFSLDVRKLGRFTFSCMEACPPGEVIRFQVVVRK